MRSMTSLLILTVLFATFTVAETAGTETAGTEETVPDLRTRTSGSDWPSFLGPGRDGRSSETLGLREWPPEGPPVAWSVEVGEGYSAPSIALGRLLLFDRTDGNARLRTFRSETGELLWTEKYPYEYEDFYGYSNGPRASPVVDGERVYTFGVEGRLRAHRVTDGKLLWDVDTSERFGVKQNFFGAGATPIVSGDLLIAHIGGSPPDSPGTMSGEAVPNGSAIVAFDKMTGEVRYQVGDELASYSSPVLATIKGRPWGFVFARGGLLGFDPEDGKIRFHYPWRAKILESVNAATPIVVGDQVFLTETYGPGSSLLRIQDDGYEIVWRDQEKSRKRRLASHWSTPIHDQGHLYGSAGRNSGNAVLKSIDLATGEENWSEDGLTRSTLLYADGHLIVLSEYGKLLLVEATPDKFSLVSEVDLGKEPPKGAPEGPSKRPVIRHPAWNAPVLAHGYLYIRGKDRLICFDLAAPAEAPKPEPADEETHEGRRR